MLKNTDAQQTTDSSCAGPEQNNIEESHNGLTTVVLPKPHKQKKVKEKAWILVLQHGDLLGMLPYATAGRRTAAGKQQQRYTVTNAPWNGLDHANCTPVLSEAVKRFERYANTKVAAIEHLQKITHGEESGQLIRLHVKETNIIWSFTHGKKNIPKEKDQPDWHTLVHRRHFHTVDYPLLKCGSGGALRELTQPCPTQPCPTQPPLAQRNPHLPNAIPTCPTYSNKLTL